VPHKIGTTGRLYSNFLTTTPGGRGCLIVANRWPWVCQPLTPNVSGPDPREINDAHTAGGGPMSLRDMQVAF